MMLREGNYFLRLRYAVDIAKGRAPGANDRDYTFWDRARKVFDWEAMPDVWVRGLRRQEP